MTHNNSYYLDKIMTLDNIRRYVEGLRQDNPHIVIGLAPGVYDLLHAGHVELLEESKKRCDVLIVGLLSDQAVKEKKDDRRPYVDQDGRAKTIAGLAAADKVIIFNDKSRLDLLTAIRPDIVFKGEEYRDVPFEHAELAGKIELIPHTEPRNTSTSRIKDLIVRRNLPERDGWGRTDVY
jgi:rfaE bifunctional protein nucleotidyltransferase chain/domain